MREGELNPADYMLRGEANEAFRALRREVSHLTEGQAQANCKLDSILALRVQEAENMGKLREQVRQVQASTEETSGRYDVLRDWTETRFKETSGRLDSMRGWVDARFENMEPRLQAPKDSVIKGLWDVLKLVLAAGLGYLMAHGVK